MRSLVIFADMLGGEYICSCNSNAKPLMLDEFFETLGGTIYTNCYTPAPDTGRSGACMWTGNYPKKNGCDHRIKYPRYFLNYEEDNLWKRLKDNKYLVNVYAKEFAIEDGLIPMYEGLNTYSESINDFFDNAEMSANSFNFFYLPDIHTIFNVLNYTEDTLIEGTNELLNVLNTIFSHYDVKKMFDYIIIFSDHGFMMTDSDSEHILDRNRTHTYIQLWEKGDLEIKYDNRLRSNLDFFPTICELEEWKRPEEIEGISLLDREGHSYILIEDCVNFYSYIDLRISVWGVIMQSGLHHWIDERGEWIHEKDEDSFDGKQFLQVMEEKLCNFSELMNVYKYGKIYLSHMGLESETSLGEKLKRRYEFGDMDLIRNKNIILYGAGEIGKAYYEQICSDSNTCVVAWVDLNYQNKNIGEYSMEVTGIDSLVKVDFDYVIIATKDRTVSDQAKAIIQQIGVPIEKVIYSVPKEILVRNV